MMSERKQRLLKASKKQKSCTTVWKIMLGKGRQAEKDYRGKIIKKILKELKTRRLEENDK